MKPYNVVFTEVVEHTVRVYADSANSAAFQALDQVVNHYRYLSWDFSRVEAENHDGSVDEVIV